MDQDYIGYIIIGIVLIIQILVFIRTNRQIKKLYNFFPKFIQGIKIERINLNEAVLNDSHEVQKIARDPFGYVSDSLSDFTNVDLIVGDSSATENRPVFKQIVEFTNVYLLKNIGAAADFELIKDICNRRTERLENSINATINTPLFLGLAGTFVGIIWGLYNLNFDQLDIQSSGVATIDGVQELINGVVVAMIASLSGLLFTLINSAGFLRRAEAECDSRKMEYFDLLQRDLLPQLNKSVNSGLTSLKSVLSHFISRFGDNISDYKDSAILLNENLKEQRALIEEVNKLKVTQVATEISRVFIDLKESAESIKSLKSYSNSLNKNVINSSNVLEKYVETVELFKGFNENLLQLSNEVSTSRDLQVQLKDSLELHFPTIDDHKVVWRKTMDEFSGDVKTVYEKMNQFLDQSTDAVRKFVDQNPNFISDKNAIEESLKLIAANGNNEVKIYESIQNEVTELREELRANTLSTLEMNREFVTTIKDFVSAKDPNIDKDGEESK